MKRPMPGPAAATVGDGFPSASTPSTVAFPATAGTPAPRWRGLGRQRSTSFGSAALALVSAALLAACGGGNDSSNSASPLAADATKVITAAATTAREKKIDPALVSDASVIQLVQVGKTQISSSALEIVYRVVVRNNGAQPISGLAATLTAAGNGVTIVDGTAVVGDLAAGASSTAADTITLRQERGVRFDSAALVWRFDNATAACRFDTGVALVFEERRLTTPMPTGTANTIGTDTTPVADRITRDTGFDGFAPALAQLLCPELGVSSITGYDSALAALQARGTALWRAAVDRVQGRRNSPDGSKLPNSDDRMLYWARVQMTKVLRQWTPATPLTDAQKEELQWQFERYSRGQKDIAFPAGNNAAGRPYRRLLISGFDVFTLGTPGTPNTGLRNGNPSAATAIALDGMEFTLVDGSTLHVETYVLPVSYDPFNRGMQEETIGPFFRNGPQRVDASITMSQGSANIFNLEAFNGRFHGPTSGNDGIIYCPAGRLPEYILPIGTVTAANAAPVSLAGSGCDIYPPAAWLGYDSLASGWLRDSPLQFSHGSLPYTAMTTARTYEGVPRPVGASSAAPEGFDVTWHTNFTYYANCAVASTTSVASNGVVNAMPTTPVLQPDPSWCAQSGGGGNYLSNESAYRNTVLRDAFGLNIPAGHIHVPVVNNFFTGTIGGPRDDNSITDSRFEAYRSAIVQQGRKLVLVVGNSLIAQGN